MTSVMEILFARRPYLNYVSPAACEASFSGSGFGVPIIVLAPFGTIAPVGGLIIAGEFPGPFTLTWTPTPGALCYNIYQVVDGELVLIFECVPSPSPEGPGIQLPPGNPEGGDTYVVTPITPEGEGPPGNPVTTPTSGDPPGDCIAWNLSWEQTFSQAGNPPATIGGSGNANGFSFSLSQGVPQFPFEDCTFGDTGSQIYSLEEGCLMNVHLSVSFSGDGIASGSIQVDVDNVNIWSPGIDLTIPGEYDFQFMLPAANNSLVEVIVFRGGNSFFADEPVSYSWTLTITPA